MLLKRCLVRWDTSFVLACGHLCLTLCPLVANITFFQENINTLSHLKSQQVSPFHPSYLRHILKCLQAKADKNRTYYWIKIWLIQLCNRNELKRRADVSVRLQSALLMYDHHIRVTELNIWFSAKCWKLWFSTCQHANFSHSFNASTILV